MTANPYMGLFDDPERVDLADGGCGHGGGGDHLALATPFIKRGIPTFVAKVGDHPDRDAWDRALTAEVAAIGGIVWAGSIAASRRRAR